MCGEMAGRDLDVHVSIRYVGCMVDLLELFKGHLLCISGKQQLTLFVPHFFEFVDPKLKTMADDISRMDAFSQVSRISTFPLTGV